MDLAKMLNAKKEGNLATNVPEIPVNKDVVMANITAVAEANKEKEIGNLSEAEIAAALTMIKHDPEEIVKPIFGLPHTETVATGFSAVSPVRFSTSARVPAFEVVEAHDPVKHEASLRTYRVISTLNRICRRNGSSFYPDNGFFYAETVEDVAYCEDYVSSGMLEEITEQKSLI